LTDPLRTESADARAQPEGRGVVWLVDDSPLQLNRAADLLAHDYILRRFSNGEEALERLNAEIGPDLLVLDWELPGMSGLEVCEFLRGRADEVTLPVLMLTSRSDGSDIAGALEAGANDYLVKPYRDLELVARVKTLVRVRQLARTQQISERLLATTLNSIGDAVLSTDECGRVVYLNRAAEALTGWTQAEAKGLPMSLVARILEENAVLPKPLEQALFEGELPDTRRPATLIGKQGVSVPIEDTAAPIRGEQGELLGVVFILRDQTAARRIETERQELLARERAARAEAEAERQKLHSLFMQAPVPIAILEGPRHVFSFANAAYRSLVGGRNVVGKTLEHALPDVREHGFAELLDRVMASGQPHFGNEVPIKLAHHAPDESLILDFVYSPKRSAAGHIDGVLFTGNDVTKDVRTRERVNSLTERLRRNEERLRLVVESSKMGTWEMMLPARELLGDDRFHELTGTLPGETFESSRALAALDVADRPRVTASIAAALAGAGEGHYGEEYRMTSDAGSSPRWVEVRGQVFFGVDRKPARFLGIAMDVTARKEVEAQLKLRASFEQQLIGIVSHDLRTPLHAIGLSAGLLAGQPDLGETAQRTVSRILSSSQRATRLVKQLLDFTQARLGGRIPIRARPTDLHELARRVLDDVRTVYPDRTLTLHQQGDGGGHWDEDRLAQMLQNLLTNAIKYSPPGTPVIVETRGDATQATLSVHNLGAPIPPEFLVRIFEPLQRGSDEVDLSGRSIGLGLYIVKAIATAHEATVEVESQASSGTLFTVRLPVRR
jgi:PAS domain S-box-containing protein